MFRSSPLLCSLALFGVGSGCASSSAGEVAKETLSNAGQTTVAVAPEKDDQFAPPRPEGIPADVPPQQWGRWILKHHQSEREAQMNGAMVGQFPEMIRTMQSLEKVGQFDQVITVAQHNAPLEPSNAQIPYLEGRAHFYLGDFEAASASWTRALSLDPNLRPQIEPLQAQLRRIRGAFPTLLLKPVAMVPSDVAQHLSALWKRALSLRNARRYDEIERACEDFQRASPIGIDGRSDGLVFSGDLGGVNAPNTAMMPEAQAKQATEAAWEKTRTQLEEWMRARPQSKWARLALFHAWLDRAWALRGSNYANKISEEQWQRVHQALAQCAQVVSKLPPTASQTPLFWQTTLSFSQLAEVPFEQFQAQHKEAAHRFPLERSFDFGMATMMLPQWSGEPNQWQRWIADRADQIGGEEGDIAYGQIVMHMTDDLEEDTLWKQPGLSWPRARRGFHALLRRHPDSVSVATWLLLNARLNHDPETARALILHLNNRANSNRWFTPAEFARMRLQILDPAARD